MVVGGKPDGGHAKTLLTQPIIGPTASIEVRLAMVIR